MAKDDGKGALAGVIASAAAENAAAASAEQLELMPPTRANLTEDEQKRVAAAIRHDRRGRPPGARNKHTRDMLDFLRRTMGDPLQRRFQYAMHTPESLSIDLGCSKFEALQFLDRLWADLSRFYYAQQAQVDGAGNAVVPRLTMMIGGHPAAQIGPSGTAQPPWIYDAVANEETQQNQPLLASLKDVSDAAPSRDDDK